jgi:hypothetical protein
MTKKLFAATLAVTLVLTATACRNPEAPEPPAVVQPQFASQDELVSASDIIAVGRVTRTAEFPADPDSGFVGSYFVSTFTISAIYKGSHEVGDSLTIRRIHRHDVPSIYTPFNEHGELEYLLFLSTYRDGEYTFCHKQGAYLYDSESAGSTDLLQAAEIRFFGEGCCVSDSANPYCLRLTYADLLSLPAA